MHPTAFTIKSSVGLLYQLITAVNVLVPNTQNNIQVMSIWDTGATGTVITEKIVNALGLIPTGKSHVHTADGSVTIQNTYIVDVILPNGLMIHDVTVTSTSSLGNCDVLIGMDIITLGDLSITHHKGLTCMSFRVPSLHEIDYVKNPSFKHNPTVQTGKAGSNVTLPKKKRK